MSVNTIQYVPPDIEGKVPEEVMRTAISEMTEGDVWKIVVMQTFFHPATGRAKYQVSAHHENEGMKRDYFFGN